MKFTTTPVLVTLLLLPPLFLPDFLVSSERCAPCSDFLLRETIPLKRYIV